MLQVRVENNAIRIGEHFSVSFQRTLRIPDDGKTYPLPPGLNRFPIHRVEDYMDKVPASWREQGGVFIPMYQREALWLSFDSDYDMPCAVKVAAGKVNAISGKAWDENLNRRPQDYAVCPDQPWLDGINAGKGYIRQFVAMPLGMGYTVEGQVTGKEEHGGLQIMAFQPKPEKMKEIMARPRVYFDLCCCNMKMGLAAGGKMKQKIYPDEYGIDTWDLGNSGKVYVHIVNSVMYRQITGMEPPATPVSAKTYTEYGLPWFDLYDEHKGDVEAPGTLAGVKSVKEKDAEKGSSPQHDDGSISIPDWQVKKLVSDPAVVKEKKV